MSSPKNDDSHVWVTWDDYHRLIEKLALQVFQSGWHDVSSNLYLAQQQGASFLFEGAFDQILCLARGGVRVGDVMSRIYDVPLGILATSSYREAAGTKQGDLDIAQFITITRGTLAGRVLLVDDMVDTGMTFNKVFNHLKEQFPAITELKSAVLWWKGHSQVTPDYYVDKLPTNPWIHQPFEDYDSLRPHQLEAWVRKGSR
ncbi:phosphoribosyl transferase domain protein [Bordetella hinzii CA90 BAL1384]|uniref:phosphoribosyltransferase n=1 Tax=Bordetella hinzii TaxID=103855 RepID=UPI00045B4FB9|nr:phosphoribosyltransferase family protein [Bordetella hinzii]KCB30353.1 phosphoribosyl transferase domain protein [Bordetella hinzii CA90 BAL1384]